MLVNERRALIREIKTAFANVKVPRRLGGFYETQELVGIQWQQFTVESVKKNTEFFAFSDNAFKYFLPGYLTILLTYPEQFESVELILALLRHLSQSYNVLRPRDLCGLFDAPQKAIIIDFLEIVEPLWMPEANIAAQVAKTKSADQDWVKRALEQEREEQMRLLNKTRIYWGFCQDARPNKKIRRKA